MARLRGFLGLVGLIFFVVAGLNFTAFMLISLALGGVNAKVEDGHYYLTNHANRTEVSERVYAYSRAHQRTIGITHVMGFIGFGLIMYAIRRNPFEYHPAAK
jgi:hypothetical protein